MPRKAPERWIRRTGLHVWQLCEDLLKEMHVCRHAFGLVRCPYHRDDDVCMPYRGKHTIYRCIEAMASIQNREEMDHHAQQALDMNFKAWKAEGKLKSDARSIVFMPIEAPQPCSACPRCSGRSF
jgi:hypothetical protein